MPMNYLVSPVQQSGSPNVPQTESTGGQLQGTQGSLGNIENSQFSGTVLSFPEVFSNAVVISGNFTTSNQMIVNTAVASGVSNIGLVITGAVQQSGSAPTAPGIVWGSGANTCSAGQGSGGTLNQPAGFFFVNLSTSGSPWMKVPFYNS